MAMGGEIVYNLDDEYDHVGTHENHPSNGIFVTFECNSYPE